MKRVHKILTSILVCFLVLSCSGCFNYKDINRVNFVTSIILDTDENMNSVVYLDCVKPYRSTNDSSDKGRRQIFKGVGKTVDEAIKNANMSSSLKLNSEQCRAYIFTEKAAKNGVTQLIDLTSRYQEFTMRPYVFVYFGDVESLFKTVQGDEEYLGLFLMDLVNKSNNSPRIIATNINDFLNLRVNGENVIVVGALELKKSVAENRVELRGGAVLKDDRLASRLTVEEGLSYNFLNDNVSSGTLEINNPQNPNSYITLEILDSKTKTDLKYDGERIKLYKKIKVKCGLAEAQKRLMIDEKVMDYVRDIEEENIKNYLTRIFQTYKDRNLDVFEIGRLFEIKYPNTSLKGEIMQLTDLVVDTEVDIEGPSIIRNTY